MDFTNLALVNFSLKINALCKYAKSVFILVDPYVLENIRSADGEIIEHFNNKQWFKVMNKLGYQHRFYNWLFSYESNKMAFYIRFKR